MSQNHLAPETDPSMSYILCSPTIDDSCGAMLLNRAIFPSVVIVLPFGRAFPENKIPKGSKVYIVDLNFPISQLLTLDSKYKLFIFSHDARNIADAIQAGLNASGLSNTGFCGCELVWKFLNDDTPMPKSVQMIADYDKWQFKMEDTKAFNYGLGTLDLYAGTGSYSTWDELLQDLPTTMETVLTRGKAISNFVDVHDTELCHDLAYVIQFHGRSFLVANFRGSNSNFFQSHPDYHKVDGYITYGWMAGDGLIRFSIYTTKPDFNIGEFTKPLGGYGREGVGGWTGNSVPWFEQLPKFNEEATKSSELLRFSKVWAARNSSSVVRSYAAKHARIGVKSQMTIGSIFGKSAAFSNCPYTWADIWFDINPLVEYGVTYCRTTHNNFRVVVCSLNGSDLLPLVDKVKGELNSFGNVVFYVDDIRRIPALAAILPNGL